MPRLPLLPLLLFLLPHLMVLPVAGQDAQPKDTRDLNDGRPAEVDRLPSQSLTRHKMEIKGTSLAFSANAGAVTLTSSDNQPEADIAFVAYTLDARSSLERPVTFVVNGGPGAASAYLHIGAIGPWLLPIEENAISPSQAVELEPNPDTWLEFTDLVFVDPVGTGFSRLVEPTERLREHYFSIIGDIDSLSSFMLEWLREYGRLASPKYFLGESYGGFRGPLLAEALQTEHGVGLSGMALVSPVLDFAWWQQPDHNPLPAMTLLPSLAASAMEKAGKYDRAVLAAAEVYASSEFLTDFLLGRGHTEAVTRVIARVAALTGLPLDLVEEHAGQLDAEDFTRELFRDKGRIASPYDTTITSIDPTPGQSFSRAADPVLDALTAPLTSAMLVHYADKLEWLPDRRYILLNSSVNRAWDWETGLSQPEALGALRRVMALDGEFRLLVAHGTADLVTPYFASELLLRQLPDFGMGRVTQENFRGGHMFYTREESRRAFAEAARQRLFARNGQ